MLLYFSSGKINPSHSEKPNLYKYKQIIEFNPITAIEYSSCYKQLLYEITYVRNVRNDKQSF